MKASKKSFHAWLYSFTYTGALPQNLCPYFWKLVWATIAFIPNFLIQLPSLIISAFKNNKRDCERHRETGGIAYVIMAFAALYLYSTIQWFRAMFDCYSYRYQFANIGMGINVIVAAIVMVLYIIFKYQDRGYIFRKTEEKEKRPSIIIEFVKAKYGKYCPKIDWE